MMRSRICLFLILEIVVSVQSNNQGVSEGEKCNTSRGIRGKCKLIQKCPAIRVDIEQKIYNHTVCGYDDNLTQIVCCPPIPPKNVTIPQPTIAPTSSPGKMTKLNFTLGYDCLVNETTEIGVIKFIKDCPGLNRKGNTNKLCKHDICRDLVCCPIENFYRDKNICWHVDDPQEEIALKLVSNQKCKVRGLNVTGIFQRECDLAKRDHKIKRKLQDVCDDDICDDRYCCPIAEPNDKFYCDRLDGYKHIEFRGPKCVDSKTGKNGTCRLPKNCITDNINDLDVCGSNCCAEYYCCPDLDVSKELLVTKKCWQYTKYRVKKEIEVEMRASDDATESRTDCIFGPSVAGGYGVHPGEHPHVAALGYQIKDEPIQWNCGGSLISERYILTAGHCLNSPIYGDVKFARMGVIHLRTNSSMVTDCPEDFGISNIISHPNYDSRYVYNDIGLVRLDRDVKFNYHIRPICLPSSPHVPDYFRSMGWGALGTSEPQSVNLIQVDQELFSYEECSRVYQYFMNRRFKDGLRNDTQICAGSRTGIESTCGGDSGGPLQDNNMQFPFPNTYTIFGIVSFGTVCGFPNSPGIYTKVHPFVNWIKKIVWK